ncbi:MAG: precorrin-8X methylmutase [Snowella sp.]|nr:precorrin-8X methylmutase [Snowella sp.]
MINYLRNGDDIYRQSFALIRAEANLEHLATDLIPIAVRLIHACGMIDIVEAIAASEKAVKIGREALKAGVPILCDAQMVAHGIIRSRLPAHNPIICTLNDPQVPAIAQQIENTRSAAAIELWKPHLKDAIVTIGNAPTALFHLLELLDQGMAKPALILGFPVGFVGAAESKAELIAHSRGVAFITLQGRRGGSAIAAAAVNALAQETET